MSNPYRTPANGTAPEIKMQYMVLASRDVSGGAILYGGRTKYSLTSICDTFDNLPDALSAAEKINENTMIVQVVANLKCRTVHDVTYV